MERPEKAARGVVLVVDDDLDVRDALHGILDSAGYETVCVKDGRMALDYLRSHSPPDLILLDMVMPAMDGFEFRTSLRRDPIFASIPTIVVSADRFVGQRWLESGITAFITKPVEVQRLLSTIEQAMRARVGPVAPSPTSGQASAPA